MANKDNDGSNSGGSNGVSDRLSQSFSKSQFCVGAAFGAFGGYMDSKYIEPFGMTLGAALVSIQLLEYGGVVRAPWNANVGFNRRSNRSSLSKDVSTFLGGNVSVIGGFAAGYFVGVNILDWTEGPSLRDLDTGDPGIESGTSYSQD